VLAWVCVLAAAGCGSRPPFGEVEGVLRRNGQPLGNVHVQFMPDPTQGAEGPRSSAFTDPQGRYRLVCDDGRPGAVVGWHRIVLYDVELREGPGGQERTRPGVSRVPLDCGTAISTSLRYEVKPGAQTHDIDLPGS
jgi:hypothetical protein